MFEENEAAKYRFIVQVVVPKGDGLGSLPFHSLMVMCVCAPVKHRCIYVCICDVCAPFTAVATPNIPTFRESGAKQRLSFAIWFCTFQGMFVTQRNATRMGLQRQIGVKHGTCCRQVVLNTSGEILQHRIGLVVAADPRVD